MTPRLISKRASEAKHQRLQVIGNYLGAGEGQPSAPQARQNVSLGAAQKSDISSPAPNIGNEGPPHQSPFENEPSKKRIQPQVTTAFRDPNQPFRHAFAGQGQCLGQSKDPFGQFKINRKYCDLKKHKEQVQIVKCGRMCEEAEGTITRHDLESSQIGSGY